MFSSASYFILHVRQECWRCETWARSPEWMGQDVLPAGSHRLTAALNKSSSILAGRLSPVMQKQREKKRTSNNVCWRGTAEAITENTFRQIANMRSKVTVESEGSNITAIWLIATKLVTEASHRQSKQCGWAERWRGEGRKTEHLSQVRLMSAHRCEK